MTRNGFTLVEILIAVVLIGLSVVALVASNISFTQANGFQEADKANNALRLWLDAEDSSTINKDEFNRVAAWNSKSNKPGNALQASNPNKPVQPVLLPGSYTGILEALGISAAFGVRR